MQDGYVRREFCARRLDVTEMMEENSTHSELQCCSKKRKLKLDTGDITV